DVVQAVIGDVLPTTLQDLGLFGPVFLIGDRGLVRYLLPGHGIDAFLLGDDHIHGGSIYLAAVHFDIGVRHPDGFGMWHYDTVPWTGQYDSVPVYLHAPKGFGPRGLEIGNVVGSG